MLKTELKRVLSMRVWLSSKVKCVSLVTTSQRRREYERKDHLLPLLVVTPLADVVICSSQAASYVMVGGFDCILVFATVV